MQQPPESGSAPRVIVIDDDPAQLDIWQRVLSRAGFTVATYDDPRAALPEIARCDCVITDYQMPGMTGIELMRGCSREQAPPFILMTGNPSPSILQEALTAGAACVLTKPAKPEAVTAA